MDERRRNSSNIEFGESLNRMNTIRALFSSIAFSLLIPIFILVIHLSGIYGENPVGIKSFMVVCECIQVIFGILGFTIIQKSQTGWQSIYSKSYFAITALSLIAVSTIDLFFLKTTIFFVMLSAYMVLVPVLQNLPKYIAMGSTAFISVLSAGISGCSPRAMVEVLVIVGIMCVAMKMFHSLVIEHEQTKKRLREKTVTSEIDPLTGLTNRRGLEKKTSVLWQCCKRQQMELGIIELDIDFFKKYNDKFGHPAGDKCLKLVAKAIKEATMGSADVVARTGGEEFMILVQDMSELEMIDLALKIRNTVANLEILHAYANVSKYVTVSIGVAVALPDDEGSFDELYNEVDRALYTAKKNGRNCVVSGNRIYGRMQNGLSTMA